MPLKKKIVLKAVRNGVVAAKNAAVSASHYMEEEKLKVQLEHGAEGLDSNAVTVARMQ